MDLICVFSIPNQKVVRFDVSMQKVEFVHFLHQIDQLTQQHAASLNTESSVADFKQIFQTGAKQTRYHKVYAQRLIATVAVVLRHRGSSF